MNIIHYTKTGTFSKPLPTTGAQTIIAIDSQLISTHQVTLPKMNTNKAHKAIPFALEPELLDDINTLAFFPKKSPIANQWNVLVIAQSVLDTLTEKLQQAQCQALAIVPDFMLLPIKENTAYLNNDTLITYRYDNFQGGCLPQNLFHQLFDDTTECTPENTHYQPKNTINLLVSNVRNLLKYLRPWRIPAIIALTTLALSTTQILISNNHLSKQLEAQKSGNEQQFRSLFPDIKRIVNIPVQAKQKLASATKQKSAYNEDFLTQLSKQTRTTRTTKITFKQKKLTLSPSK
ncbi:MAG: hypothetical protein FE834_00670 [Gammaproteobacteria bacterium]|nr:hypothetical protein [Gammaproteobacteria bacterium]